MFIYKGLTYKKFELLMKISIIKPKKELLLSELCKKIEIKRTNPWFYAIRSIMLDNDISREKDYISNNVVIDINLKRLNNYIEHSPYWKVFEKYLIKNQSHKYITLK